MHSDYSVIPSEFVCFLSMIMSGRTVKRFDPAPIPDEISYSKGMKLLECAKKVRMDDEWRLIRPP